MNTLHMSLAVIAVAAVGCTVPGGTGRLGTLARGPVPTFRSLDKRVSAEACSKPLAIDDYRKATEAAIAQVPGANALSDVSMQSKEKLSGGFCLRVSGVAGVLQ